MVKINAYITKQVFRSKSGEVLDERDNIAIKSAITNMRCKNEQVLFYTAHGKTYEEAKIVLDNYKESMSYEEEFTKIDIVY